MPHPFFISRYRDPRDLHSFPTRRSSDLLRTLGNPVLAALERTREGQNPDEPVPMSPEDMAAAQRELPDLLREVCKVALCRDRKSTRLNSSHVKISYAVFCLKKKK